ncbi:glycosyl hydrolase family 95 catalytic domain-containing protein [Promicromonospora iranensis]|uniref:Alpha-L-fucosidase 2 n=1 Tax=Promicromonospora iranensis TaxID=1105144 RepID=A0ABU2CUS6_9MICO|nr:glycoside hydrolase N-terminal domain-containing protein [Promicromonospora iranensis]MDR7385100.1 alpha-L-fucosidase 2 [Promicromonospora iranensis]
MTTLEYPGPAAEWLHALPLGNGRLGAMCWGGSAARIDLNHEGVWSGPPDGDAESPGGTDREARQLLARARDAATSGRGHEATEPLQALQAPYAQAFLPLGTLEVVSPDGGPGRRSLDLRTGTHTWTHAGSRMGGRARTVVSAVDDVLLHVVDRASPEPVEVRLTSPLHELHRELRPEGIEVWLRAPSDVAPGHEPDFPAATWGPGAVEACVVVGWRRHGDRWVLALAVETTYDGPGSAPRGAAGELADRARTRVGRVLAEDPAEVLRRHEAEHTGLFDRCGVKVGEPGPDARDGRGDVGDRGDVGGREPARTLEERLASARTAPGRVLEADPGLAGALLDHARYLLMSSSRGCRLPATLQGLWNLDMQPPWSSSYTLNINTEMNYWPAEVLGLPETVQPLEDLVVALASSGRATARRLGAEGWAAHHNSDAWAFASSVGAGHGDPAWAFWPMGGLWLVRHLVERVRFGSVDDDHVRDVVWPVLRDAAEFALSWLVRLPDGSWGTAPSTSPENTFVDAQGRAVAVSWSSAMDRALVRDVLRSVVELAPRVGADAADLAGRAAVVLPNLPGVLVATDGRVQEWGQEEPESDPHHRHVSHLYPLFPGDEALTATEEAAMAASLERRGDDSSGWSLAWKVALWARLHRPDRVSDLLDLVFRDATGVRGQWAGGLYRNLFAAHPPFQIDGNLGYAAALAECLLQSHRGYVELLPALPTELASGSAHGLVARPGLVVDLDWADGDLVRAVVRPRSLAPEAVEGRTVVLRWRGREVRRRLTSDPVVVGPPDFAA